MSTKQLNPPLTKRERKTPEWWCSTCSRSFKTSNKESHFAGKAHAKALGRLTLREDTVSLPTAHPNPDEGKDLEGEWWVNGTAEATRSTTYLAPDTSLVPSESELTHSSAQGGENEQLNEIPGNTGHPGRGEREPKRGWKIQGRGRGGGYETVALGMDRPDLYIPFLPILDSRIENFPLNFAPVFYTPPDFIPPLGFIPPYLQPQAILHHLTLPHYPQSYQPTYPGQFTPVLHPQFTPVSHPQFTPQPVQIQQHPPQRQWYPTFAQWLTCGVKRHLPKPYQKRRMQVIAALAAKQPEYPREKWTCTICVRAMDKTEMREHVLGKRHEGLW
ncbi:hypothetical protein BDD12DRAFT_810640 [Trichophaea hybrida]|nr:hypothetical protein BDD12DRAFT_810640 [Trichophaea hybrida]